MSHAMTGTAQPLRPFMPIGESGRIQTLDVVRGFALLGIFLVNIQSFGEPFGKYMAPFPPADEGVLSAIEFYVCKTLCDQKFYPLFSMLFGIGFMLQFGRVEQGGRSFGAIGFRRLAVLCVFGLIHGLLIWYGDILFLYSLVGVVLLLCRRCSPRTMLITAGVMFGVATMLATALGVVGSLPQTSSNPSESQEPVVLHVESAPGEAPAESIPPPDADMAGSGSRGEPVAESPDKTPPFTRLLEGFRNQTILDPNSQLWFDLETEAYQNGPFLQALAFRTLSFLMVMAFTLAGFGFQIMALFFVGAALAKLDIFAPEKRRWHRTFLLLGIFVGLPASALSAFLPALLDNRTLVAAIQAPLLTLCGPMVSLGYLAMWHLLITSGAAVRMVKVATGALANVGRLGLTNYIMQSISATFLMYWWGLGMFGTTTREERMIIVLGIYAVQVVLSNFYLKFFAIGPLEWVWRSLTYWRPQPLLRAHKAT